MTQPCYAVVDLETTGNQLDYDEIIQIGIIDSEINSFPVEVGRIKSEYSSQISQLERIVFGTIVGSLGVGKI